jgi:hypothetical protein
MDELEAVHRQRYIPGFEIYCKEVAPDRRAPSSSRRERFAVPQYQSQRGNWAGFSNSIFAGKKMKVAVITPYCKETLDVLSCCHDSVLSQTYACTHFLVSDGSGLADAVQGWSARHVLLGVAHDDGGNTPRAVGSLLAMNERFDAVAYLDADNWFLPSHIDSMVKLHQETGADVCSSARSLHRGDGSLMYVDVFESDGTRHVDTSCLFLTRQAFGILPLWAMMPHELGPRCDQVFWSAIKAQKFSCASSREPTVAYRTRYDVHYRNMREAPPADVKYVADFRRVDTWWASLPAETQQRWQRYFGTRVL